MTMNETTDLTLFVRTSDEDVSRWNRQRIVDALIRETNIDAGLAEAVSRDVENQIVTSGISVLTTNLIREMVDAKLIERGLEQPRRMHARLGFPLYDVRELILHRNKENANIPHGPEGTSLLLAEGIKREYAFYDVFSQDVVDAHLSGAIHIHGLGYIDRPYSSFQSLEYIKKFGMNLPNSMTAAKPARHAEVLLAHMVRFGAALHGHFTGAVAWDAVNFAFAPYLTEMKAEAVRQFAQMLVYEFSQLTAARGGQAIYTDIHLFWDPPAHLADSPAIGPGGRETGKCYRDYTAEAQKLAGALMRVFREGDAVGKPFTFPRPLMHLTAAFFAAPQNKRVLEEMCETAAEKGNPCFIFDREETAGVIADMLKANKEIGDPCERKPWLIRLAAVQNVTLNLPRLGYEAGGDQKRLQELMDERLELIARCHVQKRDFLRALLAHGSSGPLAMLNMDLDGRSYLDLDAGIYSLGVIGLNELVQIMTGQELHQSEKAMKFGLAVIRKIKDASEKLCKKHKMTFLLEQTPAESTAYRLAKLDLKNYSPASGHFIRGDISRGGLYYSNSTHLNCSADVHPLKKIEWEGRLHPFFNAGAVTELWLDEKPADKSIHAGLVAAAFTGTKCKQLMLSPEFTSCRSCHTTGHGIAAACSRCGSTDVDGIARITQYYSHIGSWNKGKLAELKDRKKTGRF